MKFLFFLAYLLLPTYWPCLYLVLDCFDLVLDLTASLVVGLDINGAISMGWQVIVDWSNIKKDFQVFYSSQ